MNKKDFIGKAGWFRNGFTLVEVLVASALFMVILALLLSVISNTTLIASNASGQIESTRIAREALDLIGRDITEASLPWARSSTNSLQFLVNPTNLGQFANQDAMFWQAPLVRSSTNNSQGNLAIVGYFVLRDLQADTKDSRFQLRRVYIDPKSTNNNYLIYSNSANWVPNLGDFAPATAAADNANAQRGWVADGVMGMWIRCLDRSGNVFSLSNGFDSRNPAFGASSPLTSLYPTNYPHTRLPAFVEVTLVCVAPRDLRRITTLPVTTNVANYVDEFRTNNPSVKSVTSFSRKFQLLNSD